MKSNLPVTGRNVDYRGDANILSTTDLTSAITYANDEFIKISGFSREELIGSAHHIVRHPDMPSAAFEHMWATLKKGRSWMGLVKNRCKNGDHYWVSAFVSPITSHGETVEYQSVRTKPTRAQVEAAERRYAQIRSGTSTFWQRLPVVGLAWKMGIGLGLLLALVLGFSRLLLPEMPVRGLLEWAAFCGLGLMFIRRTLRPLEKLRQRANAVADNPLSQELYTGRRDAFGQIEFAFQMIEAQMGAVVGRIGDTSKRLAGHTADLAKHLQHSHSTTVGQQGDADQVAEAINRMTARVAEVADSAQQASRAADQAEDETQVGHHLVDQSRTTILQLANALAEATEVVHTLENHSEEISGVLEVIHSIAEQTNLLALNAAIEAARAGDHGRGFAVVADEVRGLAQRTAQSTGEIQRMISVLQSGARDAVMAMQQSSDHAGQSVEQAQHATQALHGISQRVNQISEMSLQIASAVEQQSLVSEDINRNIISIRQASEQSVSAGQRGHSTASDVAGLAEDLRRLAEEFWCRRQ
ncbi:MAG: PAS domain-containing methyl-accepting chemotaxis protein [Pseudomonas sp.]|uniref:methyl-accepting chemotaxis protein n=1 Tax=Pseudomonas sp. TaxID=306 RepID=UPI003D0F761F